MESSSEGKKSDKPYKIVYSRAGCIECGACAKLVPDFWKMDSTSDMKADLVGSKETISKNGIVLKQELEVDSLYPHWVAYECCPIYVIKLIDNKTGKPVALKTEFNTGDERHNDITNPEPLRDLE